MAIPWLSYGGFLLAILAIYEVYRPALNGPFLFDDSYLPFLVPNFASSPFLSWIRGVRPTLQASYWANYRLFELDPYAYHLVNLILHLAAAFFVWLIARKLLELVGTAKESAKWFAIFTTAVFLLHPLQTESVSYVASRSEVLSGFFLLITWCVFLYRKTPAITFSHSALVLLFFLLALTSKEHTAALPAVLLLTDYYFNPGFSFAGIRRNWKLYAPMLAGAVLGAVVIFRFVLGQSTSAGFGMKDLGPLDYLFTQFRVLAIYLRLFLFPFGQNADYDVPVSHTLMDHGSWASLIVLLALTAAAWIYRKRFPLASFGWFLFLILLAPTSSIVPIRDVIVERRMYVPLLGLTLIVVDVLRVRKVRSRTVAWAMAVACLILAVLTWQRNQVWASPVSLWKDTVAQSPAKYRPRFQLAYAHYERGECVEAVRHYQEAAKLTPPSYELSVDWALAADCAGRPGEALTKLEEAVKLEDTAHAWALIGMVRAKQQQWDGALAALAEAEKRNPNFPATQHYKGNIHMARSDWDSAMQAFERAVALEPGQPTFRQSLEAARQAKRRAQMRKAPAAGK
jgi:tetratricopeptide (TPR) repeat protein